MFLAGRVWFVPLIRDATLIIEVGDSYVDGIHELGTCGLVHVEWNGAWRV